MLEPLFCPCCTPALLHTLAQSNLATMPRQILWLGREALAQAMPLSAHRLSPGSDQPSSSVGEH